MSILTYRSYRSTMRDFRKSEPISQVLLLQVYFDCLLLLRKLC